MTASPVSSIILEERLILSGSMSAVCELTSEKHDSGHESNTDSTLDIGDGRRRSDSGQTDSSAQSVSLDDVERELTSFAQRVSLTSRERGYQRRVVNAVLAAARGALGKECDIEIFGSAASGLCERGSDIDATIVIRCESLQRRFATVAKSSDPWVYSSLGVREIAHYIQNLKSSPLHVERVISSAKVPIVCLTTSGSSEGGVCGQTVDVSINNILPTFNTRLLHNYAKLDDRIRKLVLCVKRWAKVCGVSDAKNGNLSSYAWSLLSIYYLQVCSELPSLQSRINENGVTSVGVRKFLCPLTQRSFDVGFQSSMHIEWKCCNSVSQLFRGFLLFYSKQFDWKSEVASIRVGQRQSTDKYPQLGYKYRLFHIEDPFDLSRNLTCVLDPLLGCDKLRLAFNRCAEKVASPVSELLRLAKLLTNSLDKLENSEKQIVATEEEVICPSRGVYVDVSANPEKLSATVDMW